MGTKKRKAPPSAAAAAATATAMAVDAAPVQQPTTRDEKTAAGASRKRKAPRQLARPVEKGQQQVRAGGDLPAKELEQPVMVERALATSEEKSERVAEGGPPPAATTLASKDSFKNKEKVLVLSSRGIIYRFRHLMEDTLKLLPHAKKDAKLDNRDKRTSLNELADLKDCSSILFFECRKKKDLYIWLAKTPNGPCAKFHTTAVHTMAELKLTGNHLKGSRPLLTFSPAFGRTPHLQLLKELFMQIFSTPKDHRKVKPFFDHVISVTILDNHIWVRNYQISTPSLPTGKLERGALDKMTLVEVGPRFTLNPIKIFSGCFSGAVLYENPNYVNPNMIRRLEKQGKKGTYMQKVKAKERRKTHVVKNKLPPGELADVWAPLSN